MLHSLLRYSLHRPIRSCTELLNEIHEEEVSTHRKLLFYKWSGLFLLLAIPLIAASVSADLITKRYASWIAPLSLLLTALTILNAALRPNQRFPLLCNIGVGIRDIKMSLLLDIVNVNTENELKKCVNQRHQNWISFRETLLARSCLRQPKVPSREAR